MKKTLLIVVSVLLAVLIIVVIGFAFFGGAIIKQSINTAGPSIMGVPVTLQNARFLPLRGRIVLSGLHVGNPEGFKTESLFDAGRIDVQVSLRSLFSDTIVIRKILVDAPEITFERGLRSSNLGALADKLGSAGSPEAPAPSPAPAKETKPAKKVVIDELTISGGKVKLSVTAAMGLSAPIALAQVQMKNIGREGEMEGIGVADVTRIIVETVLKSVLNAVGGAGGLAKDGAKAIGGGAKQVGEAAVDSVKVLGGDKAAEGLQAMGAGAAQVGGAAVEGVKNIGSDVGKAIGGLFGGGKTNAPAPAAP